MSYVIAYKKMCLSYFLFFFTFLMSLGYGNVRKSNIIAASQFIYIYSILYVF